MISSFGSGGALVPVGPDWNPNSGGGPIRIAPGSNVVAAHAGNYVHRTPHLVVREAEPGAGYPGLENLMFLPDGRLVPRQPYADNMFQGAEPEFMKVVSVGGGGATSFIKALIPAAGMFTGAAIGYKVTTKHHGLGAFTGAVLGGILGAIFR